MAAQVIHFGWDDYYRVPVLRSAGFVVREAKSLDELSVALQMDDYVDAVIVSEDIEPTAERATEMVRRALPAPVILFSRSQLIDERKFDRVYGCTTPPDIWLHETAALIARGYKLKAEATRLRAEAALAEKRREWMRAHGLRRRRPPISTWSVGE